MEIITKMKEKKKISQCRNTNGVKLFKIKLNL